MLIGKRTVITCAHYLDWCNDTGGDGHTRVELLADRWIVNQADCKPQNVVTNRTFLRVYRQLALRCWFWPVKVTAHSWIVVWSWFGWFHYWDGEVTALSGSGGRARKRIVPNVDWACGKHFLGSCYGRVRRSLNRCEWAWVHVIDSCCGLCEPSCGFGILNFYCYSVKFSVLNITESADRDAESCK